MENGNGSPKKLSEIVNDLLGAVDARRALCLRGWTADYPHVRSLLLGWEVEGKRLPAGTLTLFVDGTLLRMTARWPALCLEVSYSGKELPELLEIFETDLQNKTCPWRQDWTRRKRESDTLRKELT